LLAWAPRDQSCARREARGRISHGALRHRSCCSLPERAPDRSRSRRGPVLPFRWAARPAEPATVRAEKGSEKGSVPHIYTNGITSSFLMIGEIPCWRGLRGISPAPAGKLGGGSAMALCARDLVVRFQSGLRTDPAPLRVWGAPRDQSCARREARGRFSHGALRRRSCCSLPERAPDRSRSRLGPVLARGPAVSAGGPSSAAPARVRARGSGRFRNRSTAARTRSARNRCRG
jgi:hypothetical protein